MNHWHLIAAAGLLAAAHSFDARAQGLGGVADAVGGAVGAAAGAVGGAVGGALGGGGGPGGNSSGGGGASGGGSSGGGSSSGGNSSGASGSASGTGASSGSGSSSETSGLASASATSDGSPVLSRGHIEAAQWRLRRRGVSVPADGNLDRSTQRALAEFQRQHDLPVTGVPDPATMERLQAGR